MHAPPASQGSPIHIAIVEDDASFMGAFLQAIHGAPDLRLVGSAGNRAQGLALLEKPPADVLLVDLGLPDGSGIDVIRAASRLWPQCGIMVSTTFGDETHVMQSIEAGAAGYLLKDSEPGSMTDEIRSLARGGSPISPIIARLVLGRFRKSAVPEASALADPATPSLSAREKQVLDYITKGFTADEIARLMDLSRYTVQTFVRRIYSKLKVTSKAEAIYEARSQGLLSP